MEQSPLFSYEEDSDDEKSIDHDDGFSLGMPELPEFVQFSSQQWVPSYSAIILKVLNHMTMMNEPSKTLASGVEGWNTVVEIESIYLFSKVRDLVHLQIRKGL